jgi:hypothetical protein
MFEPSELRSSREEWNLNGVKNLLGANIHPKTLPLTEMEMPMIQKPFDSWLSKCYKLNPLGIN